MKILGLTLGQCSGAAFFMDNKIVFASSEERYTRRKSDETYPINSINDGLRYCKIDPQDLDQVVIASRKMGVVPILLRSYTSFSVKDNLTAMEKYWYPKLVKKENLNMLQVFESKIFKNQYPFNAPFAKDIDFLTLEHPPTDAGLVKTSNLYKKAISSHLGIDESKIIHLDHHACHAAYAFYGSPIRDDKTLIFTADAWGDDISATISIFDKKSNKIIRLKEYNHLDFRLARIYRYVTLYLRMQPNEHEYKVMGLASYYDGPKIKEVEKIFDTMQTLNGLEFKFNKNIADIFDYLQNNLKDFRFDHIAAGLQSFTEKIITAWFKNAVREFGSDVIVFSGGISMNVKANMKISQLPEVRKFFVCGGGGDESLNMGSCYLWAESQNIFCEPLENLYLGPNCDYKDDDLSQLSNRYKVSRFDNIEQVLTHILDEKVVATCLGRMEMGPRALGNRSILADPRNRENVDKINRKIKNRDFWMPFAPVILHEYQNEIIVNPKELECPHMTIAFDTIDGKRRMPAAVHQYDGTARPLILKKEVNPIIWHLVKRYYDKTGIPALLNTSFNLHGEPLVNNLKDALFVFDNSDLDVLLLDRHVIERIN